MSRFQIQWVQFRLPLRFSWYPLANVLPTRSVDRVERMCFRCGDENHIASNPKCPARNSTCSNCSKVGHWKKVCKSSVTNTKVSSVCSSTSSFSSLRPTIAILPDNKCTIDVIVDTGADVPFLNIADYAACSTGTCNQCGKRFKISMVHEFNYVAAFPRWILNSITNQQHVHSTWRTCHGLSSEWTLSVHYA